MKKIMMAVVLAALASTGGFAGHRTSAGARKVLKGGAYSATVKALVCEACPPEVEKTLKELPGIQGVTVSKETSSVSFRVKKGGAVKVSKLQAALKETSEKMGMGADFSLSDLKRAGP